MSTPAVERYVRAFEAALPHLPGGALPWLKSARLKAMDAFARDGFPTTRQEGWKYTSVAPLEKQTFEPASPKLSARIESASRWQLAADAHLLVFVDGTYAPALSRPGALKSGAVVTSLSEVLATSPHYVEEWLARPDSIGSFSALNTALMSDGVFIQLADGVTLDHPVHVLYLATQAAVAVHPRNIVVAGENAAATVVEHYVGLTQGAYFTNAVTEIKAGPGARIEHYKMQQEAGRAIHIAGIHARQETESRFDSHSLSLGALLARNDIAARFGGLNCEATLNGLYVAAGRQHVDHHTRIDHTVPHGTSREFYRGILDDAARGVFSGRVIVHKEAQHTDAAQSNHNLLLSPEAEVDTRPQLEIYADDVKCSHGATVGQLDENMLFYLRSRGLDAGHARDLLIYAFASEVLERIRITALRRCVETELVARMRDSERLKELI